MAREHFKKPRRNPNLLNRMRPHEVIWQQVAPLLAAFDPIEGATFVYVIGEEDGPVKIGFAKDPLMRLRSMQTGNPRRIRIEHVLFGTMETEKLLHEIWGEYALAGEWFKAEIRPELCPIMADAANRQRQILGKEPGTISHEGLDLLVRAAHAGRDFKPKDEVRLLGAGASPNITRNRSRI